MSQTEVTTEAAEADPFMERPLDYMRRTREWYLALGYDTPYVWAHHDDAPFVRLSKPLSQATVAIVTTAAPYDPTKGAQGPGAPYNAAAKFYEVYSGPSDTDPDLRISHVAIDRRHANMAEQACWLPLAAARRAAASGRIGAVAARFHGLPTNRSQRHTLDVDAPALLAQLREDGADVAVLVPNCPVCNQSVSLTARVLEEAGIVTVIIGTARDIVEHCGVPRLLFSDFPLGNAAGRPGDVASQDTTFELALRMAECSPGPRTTMQSPLRWSDDPSWKLDYCNPARTDPAEMARRRAENEAARIEAKALRESIERG